MKVTVTLTPLHDLACDAVILPVREGQSFETGPLADLNARTGGALASAFDGRSFHGKEGEVETLYPVTGLGRIRRVALVGLGGESLDAEGWRRAVSCGVGALKGKATELALVLPEGLDASVAASAGAESALLSAYTFAPYRKPDPEAIRFAGLTIVADAAVEPAVRQGEAMAQAVSWVRDLSNTPGNKLTVSDLVAEAQKLSAYPSLKVTVHDYPTLKAQGLGCLAAVGQGSENKPAFVVVEYRGGQADEAPVALVGKGVTFDTGGICIKPRGGMEEMKTDMHGAATVLGVLKMAAERKLAVNLVGLLPIAENMPSGDAIKPGDIVTAYNGMTVEIVDTDAEGRLILADGIAYAVKNFKPRCVIDLATLTGSIIMALAYEATGLFTNSDTLASELKAAGDTVGERLWRFPTWESYMQHTKSDIADVRNVGHGKGDAINAAMFLSCFAGDTPWVHLDIAGSSFIPDEKPYRPKGSTGVGVRMLIQWLENGLKR